jgi:glutaredoxin 3
MAEVLIYSTGYCGYCAAAKRLLEKKGVAVTEVMVDQDPAQREHMERISGRRTVPQIFIGGTHVGGYDELRALDRAGGLDPLLNT